MKKDGLRYFLYARKSSEGEDRQVQSNPDQIRLLDKKAEDCQINIVKYFKEEKSAKKPNNRPVFDDMMTRIENGEADGIICWQINRLSRNPIDSSRIQWNLQEGIIKSIRTYDREYLPDDNALVLSVESGMANQYVRDLSKNTIRGLDSKLEKGWITNLCPIGYLNDKTKEQGERDVIIDPERFHLIRKMWDLMLTGTYSVSEIIRIANDDWGLRTRKFKRKGGNKLSQSGVYRMFNNQFYAGLLVRRDGREFQGSHPPMITMDEFDRVQDLLGSKGKPRPQKHFFAFTGFIRCGECGCLLTAEEKQKWIISENKYRTYKYYHCTKKKRDIKCQQKGFLREELLEQQVDTLLEQYTILPEFREWALDILRKSNGKEIMERNKVNETIQKAVTDAQKQLDNLTQMRLKDLIDDAEYIDRKRTLKQQLEAHRKQLRGVESRADKWLELTEKAFDFATYARIHFTTGDWRKRKEILMALGQNPTIKDGKLTIQPNEWLKPIAEAYPALEKEYRRLELQEYTTTKAKRDAFTSLSTHWGG